MCRWFSSESSENMRLRWIEKSMEEKLVCPSPSQLPVSQCLTGVTRQDDIWSSENQPKYLSENQPKYLKGPSFPGGHCLAQHLGGPDHQSQLLPESLLTRIWYHNNLESKGVKGCFVIFSSFLMPAAPLYQHHHGAHEDESLVTIIVTVTISRWWWCWSDYNERLTVHWPLSLRKWSKPFLQSISFPKLHLHSHLLQAGWPNKQTKK